MPKKKSTTIKLIPMLSAEEKQAYTEAWREYMRKIGQISTGSINKYTELITKLQRQRKKENIFVHKATLAKMKKK